MRLLITLAVLPALVFSCAADYDSWLDGRCFRLNYYTSVPNGYVQDYCKNDGARLPAIKSAEERTQFSAAIRLKTLGDTSFWLGLKCDGQKFVWADGTEAEYTNFKEDTNCTSADKNSFYYVDNSGFWFASTDNYHYGVNNIVCEALARSSSSCDYYDVLESGKSADTCYRLNKQTLTWQGAENICSQQGAHLAIVHDQTLNDYLRRTAVSNGLVDGLHIGIKKNDTGDFSWIDGSVMDYDNFVPGFPNEAYGDCVAMETGFLPGQWMNVPCYNTQLPSVCTKPAFIATNPQPAGCPKMQYAPGEEIYSPSYPQAPGVGSCDYLLLEPNSNKRAEVVISFFETNSCCDTLTIYDGLFGSTILKTLTGYVNGPVTVHGNSNALRMEWNSTSGAHVRGFKARMSPTV